MPAGRSSRIIMSRILAYSFLVVGGEEKKKKKKETSLLRKSVTF